MKTSIRRIVEFQRAAELALKGIEGDPKIKYAIQKVVVRLVGPIEEYNELKADLEIEHANVDENKSILCRIVDGKKEYDYTKEGTRALNKAIKELFNDPRFEVKPHICAELPDNFNNELRPFLEGFILPPATESE